MLAKRKPIAWLVGRIIVDYIPLSLIIWACVKYGQEKHTDSAECAVRSTDRGLLGLPDFYGLGIRLGLYLQWFASLIALLWYPKEVQVLAVAYYAFSLALIIALFAIIFQGGCVFTVEIVVLLAILWIGYIVIILAGWVGRMLPELGKKPDIRIKGLVMARRLWYIPLFAVSAWFWVRIATAGQVDFKSTPGGTSFFFLVQVHESAFSAVAYLSLVLVIWFALSLLFIFSDDMDDRVAIFLVRTQPYVVMMWLICNIETRIIWFLIHAKVPALYLIRALFKRQQVQVDGSPFVKWQIKHNYPIVRTNLATAGAIVAIMGIASIETTLKWNNVSGIYEVRSTGQLIPLIMSISTVISIHWKVLLRPDEQNLPSPPREVKKPDNDQTDIEQQAVPQQDPEVRSVETIAS